MEQRIPPSGPFVPIARLLRTTNQAFADGVQAQIIYDTVDFSKGDPGVLDPLTGDFFVNPGLYLVQVQVSVSVSLTTMAIGIAAASASASDNTSIRTPGTLSQLNGTLNALRRGTETPISPTRFADIFSTFTGVGAAGNISKAECLIYRLGGAD